MHSSKEQQGDQKAFLSDQCKGIEENNRMRKTRHLFKKIRDPKGTHWSWQTASSNNAREDSTHGHHQMINTKIRLIIFFAAKDGEALQSTKTRLGADCSSDHELLIAKFRLKLNKVGKTTRPFRYDLIQIPYDYTVEVRNRFNGLDLLDRLPDELWTEVRDIVQETRIKTIPMERNAKKQNGCLGRPYK